MKPGKTGIARLIDATGYSLKGLKAAYRNEAAFRQEILLVLVGGLFVIEALSVIFQVSFFKMTSGRRILRMAPLHHHFELKGWPEPKVIVRFWIIAIALALLAMSTLKLR